MRDGKGGTKTKNNIWYRKKKRSKNDRGIKEDLSASTLLHIGKE